MRVKILRTEYSRGQLDSIECTEVEIQGKLWPYARSMATEERMDASRYMREFYSRARSSGNGAYGYGCGEDSAVYLIPEGHPNFDLDYDNVAGWDEAMVDRWAENLGDVA